MRRGSAAGARLPKRGEAENGSGTQRDASLVAERLIRRRDATAGRRSSGRASLSSGEIVSRRWLRADQSGSIWPGGNRVHSSCRLRQQLPIIRPPHRRPNMRLHCSPLYSSLASADLLRFILPFGFRLGAQEPSVIRASAPFALVYASMHFRSL